MTMTRWTLALSLFLIVVGVVAYLGTGRQSMTALIPTFLGMPLLACALWARRDAARPKALHLATFLALLGLGGTATGLLKTVRLLIGDDLERPQAAVVQAVVALACLAYVALALASFFRARRARSASAV
jgi:hypothetical protein